MLKGIFVPKGIPIGFQMDEKNTNTQTNKHRNIFVFSLYK